MCVFVPVSIQILCNPSSSKTFPLQNKTSGILWHFEDSPKSFYVDLFTKIKRCDQYRKLTKYRIISFIFFGQKLVSCSVGAWSPWCRRLWQPWRCWCHLCLRLECPWRVRCVIEVRTSDNTSLGSQGNGGNGSANSMLSAFHVSSQVWRCLATESCILWSHFRFNVSESFWHRSTFRLTRLGCCWQLPLLASWRIDFLSRLEWLGLASVCRFTVFWFHLAISRN